MSTDFYGATFGIRLEQVVSCIDLRRLAKVVRSRNLFDTRALRQKEAASSCDYETGGYRFEPCGVYSSAVFGRLFVRPDRSGTQQNTVFPLSKPLIAQVAIRQWGDYWGTFWGVFGPFWGDFHP